MTSWHNLNFANQDLRNRCFKGQNLKGADFSHSDIRGCDFSCALLMGANFEQVRTGLTLRKVIILLAVAMIVAFLMAQAVTRTVYGAIGLTVGEKGWSYILALLISLFIAGTGSAVGRRIKSQLGTVAFLLSGVASAALLGFYYTGIATNKNPQAAIVGAVVGGVLMAAISWRFRSGGVAVAIAMAGTVTSYGLAFWLGATGIAFLSVQNFVWGIFWSSLSLIYIWLTIQSFSLTLKEIRKSAGTSFKNADLTDARFDKVQLSNTDFSGAIGVPTQVNNPFT